jgi:8-oxo-dGTP pyrophosphatase MutT (NUDIX family)
MLKDQDQWLLLFTRRTDLVDSHQGQVAFPGGVIDANDDGPVSAALRETQEEIGVPPEEVDVLGLMDPMPTITEFCVTPVIGVIPWPYPLTINPYEVAATFVTPLEWLSNPENLEIRHRDSGLQVEFFKPYRNEVIWGVTARITLDFLAILQSS